MVKRRRGRRRAVRIRASAVALIRVLNAGHLVPRCLTNDWSAYAFARVRKTRHSRNSAGCNAQVCCSPASCSPCPQTRARACPPSKPTSASIPTAAPPPALTRPASSRSADACRRRTFGSRRPRTARCSRSRSTPPGGHPRSSRRRSTRTRTRRPQARTRGRRRERCTSPECSCSGAGSTRTTPRRARTCRLRSRRQSTIRPGGRSWGSRKTPWSM
jgi:hypothetical protein